MHPLVAMRRAVAYVAVMGRDQVIATLRRHQLELRHRGVLHATLFGSVARGEATGASDIDIMVDIAPDAALGVFEYVDITQFIADLFPIPVDVANRNTLKPLVRTGAERDEFRSF